MKYLVDTHIILWTLLNSPKLSDTARQYLEDRNNTFYYSIANVWEVGIKHMLAKADFPISARQFADYCEEAGYIQLDISVKHIETLENLKTDNDHRDPFDRMLLAQAKAEKMGFISHDSKLAGYHEQCFIVV